MTQIDEQRSRRPIFAGCSDLSHLVGLRLIVHAEDRILYRALFSLRAVTPKKLVRLALSNRG